MQQRSYSNQQDVNTYFFKEMATIINFYERDQLQHSTKKTCNKDCSSCHKTYCPIHISTSNSEVHKDVKWHIKHSLLMPSVLWRCWLGGRKSTRPVKNRVVGYWHGYLSGARCRLAYGSADATATHCLLLHANGTQWLGMQMPLENMITEVNMYNCCDGFGD